MPDKIYTSLPENYLEGPGDRPFYYGISKGEEQEYFRIVPSSGVRIISSDNIIGDNKFELLQGKKILIFETHSDDAVIQAGDLLLKLKKAENQIHIINLISCHLAVGGNLSIKEKKKVRDDEDRAFAREIGVSIQFLRLEFPYKKIETKANKIDGFLELKDCRFGSPELEDFEKVYQVLESERPDMMLLPHPFDYHQMHRDVSNLVLNAVVRTGFEGHLMFYGSRKNFQRFGIATGVYNLLSNGEAKEKLDLIRIFKSQFKLFLTNRKLIWLKDKKMDEEEREKALCDFLIGSLSGDEMQRLKIKSPYCERFVEFKVNREVYIPG